MDSVYIIKTAKKKVEFHSLEDLYTFFSMKMNAFKKIKNKKKDL